MPWIKIDDHFDEHPKLAKVGPIGWAFWLAGLAYCNRNLTDGFIPWATARALVSWEYLAPATDDPERELMWTVAVGTGMHGQDVDCPYAIGLLVDARLWDEVTGGYRVHDYEDYQPTKASVLADRAAKVAAGRAGGIAAAKARATADAEQEPSSGAAEPVAKSKPVPVPVPKPNPVSEPVSVSVPESESARATDNDPWYDPEGEALTWLSKHGVSLTPGNGYHRALIGAVEQHGINAVIGMLDRLAEAGTHNGDAKGFVFGAKDALDQRTRPKLADLERGEREEERGKSFAERVAATKQRNDDTWGDSLPGKSA